MELIRAAVAAAPVEGDPAHQAGSTTAKEETAQEEENCSPITVIPADEVSADEARYLGLHDVVRLGPGLTLLRGQVTDTQAASLLGRQELQESDLLPGQYEGGFKVWEGSIDLAEHVIRLWQTDDARESTAGPGSMDQQPTEAADQPGNNAPAPSDAAHSGLAGRLAGQRAIELGCGHALPGLIALMAGAEVHFQDYNREVLQTITIPNVAANWEAWAFRGSAPAPVPADAAQPSDAGGGRRGGGPPARYFSGDWGSLGAVLRERGLEGSYDLVLSAETIYSLDSMRQLYQCIKRCLKRPAGMALVAAKSYYFGVGGGTAAFVRLVEEEGEMRAEVAQVVDDGLSNKREIIRLSWAPAGGGSS